MQNFESPLQNSEKPQKTQDEPIEDSFAQIEAWQNDYDYQKEAAERARRLVEATPTDDPGDDDAEAQDVAKQPRFTKSQKATAGVLVGAAAVTVGGTIIADNTLPRQEVGIVTETIQQNGDITTAVDQGIGFLEKSGVDPASTTNRQDVISQAVELTAENGVVQPGQQVTIEATEKPFSHQTVYQAVPNDQNK